jgi:ubiquinol-cytochrome c reductase cytochrome c1 subunit
MLRAALVAIGAFFSLMMLWSFGLGAIAYVTSPPVETVEHEFHKHELREIDYSFAGPLGKYDTQQLQRGFQVYKEVCTGCHSLSLVAFRDLEHIGYSPAAVKAIARQWPIEVPDVNPDTGEAATRKAVPADRFPSPFPNEVAARAANNKALPPDLSLMAKAREGGPAYIASLLTGYSAQPAELLKHFPDAKTPVGLFYNPYFANLNLAMPPPLAADDLVAYSDGTKATKAQMAEDVSAFLMWTAEPKLVNRHIAGLAVIIFLLFTTGLAYMAYRNVWADKKH